jgi:hypothetical protein
MNWLVEGTLYIWMFGAVALTMALIVYFQTRTNGALIGVGSVVLVIAILLVISWLVVTPREAVENALYKLATTVEANDVKGSLAFLSPLADPELRSDVESLMPLVKIKLARVVGTPQIDMHGTPDPNSATVHCQGVIKAVNKKDGMEGGAADQLVLQWVRSGDRWLLESYTSEKNWNRAVGR